MKSVLYVGVVLCLLVLTVTAWDDNDEACANELKLNKVEMKRLNELDIFPYNDDKFNKFLECSWKKEGSIDANGNADWTAIYKLLDDFFKDIIGDPAEKEPINAMFVKAVDACKASYVKASTVANTIISIHNCLSEKIP